MKILQNKDFKRSGMSNSQIPGNSSGCRGVWLRDMDVAAECCASGTTCIVRDFEAIRGNSQAGWAIDSLGFRTESDHEVKTPKPLEAQRRLEDFGVTKSCRRNTFKLDVLLGGRKPSLPFRDQKSSATQEQAYELQLTMDPSLNLQPQTVGILNPKPQAPSPPVDTKNAAWPWVPYTLGIMVL